LLLFFILILIFYFKPIGRLFYPFPYQKNISYYAQKNDLNPYLLAAVIKTESNFNPRAISAKGARGLMQIMPKTGRWVALQTGQIEFKVEQLDEPEINICLGSWYLAELKREFYGNTILALAAYNGGRENVSRWLQQKQWVGELTKLDSLPFPETRQFIRKVLWNYKVYRYLYG
jgi:soluble lytic murein transglycosylase